MFAFLRLLLFTAWLWLLIAALEGGWHHLPALLWVSLATLLLYLGRLAGWLVTGR